MRSIYLSVRLYSLLFVLAVSMTAISPSAEGGMINLSKKLSQVILQRNDIFARHGYIFKSSELNRHYKKQGWYRPDKKFTWNRLTAQERKQVNTLQQRENKFVSAQKNMLQQKAPGSRTRYFKNISYLQPFSTNLRNEIKKFMKKKDIYPDYYIMPLGRGFTLKNEIPRSKLTGLQGEAQKTGKSLTWYRAVYSPDGKLKSLGHCWFSETLGEGILGTWYLDNQERIALITKAVSQTTLGTEWLFQYADNMLVWMTFEIKSYAGSDYRVTKKFFP